MSRFSRSITVYRNTIITISFIAFFVDCFDLICFPSVTNRPAEPSNHDIKSTD